MRVSNLVAICLLSSAACAQATGPSAPPPSFSAPMHRVSLSANSLTGLIATGGADLIYALQVETKRQNPSLPEAFGGLSSLSIRSIEGDTILFDAVTDQGHLARFSAPNPIGKGLADLPTSTQVELWALTDSENRVLGGASQIDSEGLAPTDTGFLISFERNHRLLERIQTEAGARTHDGPNLTGFDGLEPNGGMEALARLPNGQYLASAEYGPDRLSDPAAKLQAPYWIFDLASKATTAPLGRFENQGRFGITDIRILDEEVWVLKRSYDPSTKITLARLETCSLSSVLAGKPLCSVRLALAPPFLMDNYEGLAVMKEPGSEATLVFMLSDDNFSADQGTYLLALRLGAPARSVPPSPGATP